jgi:hypothetical protein
MEPRLGQSSPVGGKLDGGVKTDRLWIHASYETLHARQIQLNPVLPRVVSPHFRSSSGIRQELRSVDKHEGFAIDSDVTIILKCPDQMLDMSSIILRRILLREKDFPISPVPSPRPVLVGPA